MTEDISVLFIALGLIAGIFLVVMWIVLPVAVFKMSGKMDRIIKLLEHLKSQIP